MSKPIKFRGGSSKGSSPRPDTFKSNDTVEIILGLGEGPMWGPAEGAKSLYLDQTPLVNQAGFSNFSNMTAIFYPGSELGEEIKPRLGGFSNPVSVSVNLEKDVPVVRTGVQTNIDFLDVRLAVQALYKNDEDKGPKATTAEVKIEYKATSSATWLPAFLTVELVPAPTEGAEGATFVYQVYDPNDVTDAVGMVILADPSTVDPPTDPTGPGTIILWPDDPLNPYQPYIFDPDPMVDDWVPVGTPDTPTTWILDDPYGDAPGTTTRVTIEGAEPPSTTESKVRDIYVKDSEALIFNGDYWTPPYATTVGADGILKVNEKISQVSVKEVRIPVERIAETYDIRVTQLSDDTSEARVSEITFESFQEIVAEPMTFPGTAMLQFIAQANDQFSGLPTIQGIYKGRIVKVPTNYNPTTRVYTGVWDGLFTLAWTDNPAWIFMDFVENTRYGLSRAYPHTCNKWSIYDWAVYCDVQVPDGAGGTRPRWTFNHYQTEPRSAKEFAQFLAGAAGARYYDDGNGFVDIIFDNPDDMPVALFTNEDVVDGLFNYSHLDRQSRANRIVVQFKNKDLFYRTDTRVVEDLDDQETYGILPDEFIAEGCRSVSEALARARLRLITNLTEKEFVSFGTQRKGRYLRPWDIILIADADAGYGVSGRITSQAGNDTWGLDAPITIEPGVDYYMTFDVVNPDYPATSKATFKTIRSRITTGVGTHSTITTEDEIPGVPDNHNYSIESETLGFPKAYRVLKIDVNDSDQDQVSIEAFEINRSKYTFIDGTEDLLEDDDARAFYNGVIEVPTGFKGHIVREGQRVFARLSWDEPDNKYISRHEIRAGQRRGSIVVLGETTANSFDTDTVDFAGMDFYLTPIDFMGKRGPSAKIAFTEVKSRYIAPPTNLELKGGGTTATSRDFTIVWDEATVFDPLFETFVVEVYDADGTTFRRTQKVGYPLEYTYKFEQNEEDGLSRTIVFKVRAQDIYGNLSSAITATITNPAPALPASPWTLLSSAGPAGLKKLTLEYPTDPDFVGWRLYYHYVDLYGISPTNDETELSPYLSYEGPGPVGFNVQTGKTAQSYVLVAGDSFGWDYAGAIQWTTTVSAAEGANVPAAHTHVMNNITDLTAFAKTLLDDTSAADMRTTLELGSAALKNIGTSGDALGLLNTANTYSETQTFSNGSVGLAMSSRSPITFNGNANIRAWDSANTDIDALIPGTASGLMINGMINGHVVVGIRGNDTSDGFYIIDTTLGGSGSYNRMLFELTPASLQYMGSNIAYESKAMTWGAAHVWSSGNIARFTSGLSIGTDNDQYIYPTGSDSIGVRVGNSAAYRYFQFNEGGAFYTPDGSAAAPGWAFGSDTNTGVYRIGADILGFATGGTERFRIGSNGAAILTADGTSNAFVIQGSGNGTIGPGQGFTWTNSGAAVPLNQSIGRIYWSALNDALAGETFAYMDVMATDNVDGTEDANFYLTLISGGTRGVKFTVTGDGTGTFANLMRTGVGAAATPAWSFSTDPDTGIFRSAANTLNFATAGVSRMYIDSAGVIQFEGSARWTTANPLILDTAPATQRLTVYKSSSLNRWAVGVDSGAESGSDVGSSYVFYYYNDAGTYTGAALTLSRTNGSATFGSYIRSGNGSVSFPAYSFSSDTNTGLYWIGADNIGISTGGTLRLGVSTTAVTSTLPIYAPAGSGAAPGFAFSTDTDTGLFLGNTNELRLVTGGNGRWGIQSTGHMYALANYSLFGGDGAVGAPGFSFTNDTNSGIYRIGADNIGISLGGTKYADFATSLIQFIAPVQAPVAVSSQTGGTLTVECANKHVNLTSDVTLNNSVFTANSKTSFDPGASNRTFTRGTGVTMYVNGVNRETATLAANQAGGMHWRDASTVILSGAFS